MANEKRLIDANKFFDTVRFADADLCEEDANDNLAFGFTREAIKYMLDEQPTVDAVEVVRCKDCKWWHDYNCTNKNGAGGLVVNGNWFCRAGERKDNER